MTQTSPFLYVLVTTVIFFLVFYVNLLHMRVVVFVNQLWHVNNEMRAAEKNEMSSNTMWNVIVILSIGK